MVYPVQMMTILNSKEWWFYEPNQCLNSGLPEPQPSASSSHYSRQPFGILTSRFYHGWLPWKHWLPFA